MTKFLTLFTALVAVSAAPALAQDSVSTTSTTTTTTTARTSTYFPGEFTANVALTSDYSFRGISQSDEGPAVQGGFDYSYDVDGDSLPGLYAGIWASSVDFNDGDEASVEADLYAGIQGDLGMINSTGKLGVIYYAYPGADSDLDYDYWEVAASLSHDFGFMSGTLSENYSPDYFGGTGDAWYTAAAVSVPLPYEFSVNGHVGYQSVDDTADYWDWSAGVGYTWNGFGLNLNYVDTDLDEPTECLDGCSDRVIFSVSKTF